MSGRGAIDKLTVHFILFHRVTAYKIMAVTFFPTITSHNTNSVVVYERVYVACNLKFIDPRTICQ